MFKFISVTILSFVFLNPHDFSPLPPTLADKAYWAWCIPIVTFVIICIILGVLHRLKFSLKNTLSEIKIINSTAVYIESSSRLMAFLSGVIALMVAVTIAIVSIYSYMVSATIPPFEKLTNVLLALGIGVVPYTINKVAGAFKSNNT